MKDTKIQKTIDLKKLLLPLPKPAIKQHPTKTYLSSIKAIYVTERFNDVFGIGKWSIRVEKEHVNHDNGMVIVKVIFEVKELGIYYESYGGNDNGGVNNKNFDLGDAYKGATTDAMTKIGSFMGVGIDVFKGLHNTQNENTNNLEWLKDVDLEKVIQQAKSKGMKAEDLRRYYKINKANFEVLKKEL